MLNMRIGSNEVTPQNFGMFFLQERFDEIYNQCHETFQEIIAFEQFNALAKSFNEHVQNYQLLRETTVNHLHYYIWIDEQQEKAIHLSMDANNIIHSLLIKPFLVFPKSDENYTTNTYVMPIKDEWYVFWGGTNEFVNYHYVHETQRYAYDLVILKNGTSFNGSALRNEDYYAFNKEVIAPADGKVIRVVDHLKDNVPGEMMDIEPAGNLIIIEHPNNEYSMVAHLKYHSSLVQVGDTVRQGDVIALCGNSGNSSEPHIHFQVMDSQDYLHCKSIRIRFAHSIEPIQGDFVK